jgi:hypothetical protein
MDLAVLLLVRGGGDPCLYTPGGNVSKIEALTILPTSSPLVLLLMEDLRGKHKFIYLFSV